MQNICFCHAEGIMARTTAVEFQRKFGAFQHQARREPVEITRHGRRELVLMSADHYDWLVAEARRASRTTEAPEVVVDAVRRAEMDPDPTELELAATLNGTTPRGNAINATKCCKTWEVFQSELATLEKKRAAIAKDFNGSVSDLLFRGQANSSWKLQTSLERQLRCETFNLLTYYNKIWALKSEIEAFTAHTWDIPDSPNYGNETTATGLPIFSLPVMEYMAYLRHHGFPSPLLDWTTSPYVAAYFAFADGNSDNDSVAIYAYLEYAGQGKGGWVNEPQIRSWGPYLKTHTRHFLQRCQYTVCTRPDDQHLVYTPHESVLQKNEADQDLLWKFTIARSERTTVLRYLDRHNITAFSLFASEDRLMETLAVRSFVLDE
jgi:prevent-host-death family protein